MRVLLGWHDGTIAHMNDAVAIARSFGIVRDHQHRLPQLLVRLAQHFQNNFGILRIEVAGRLVGQHDGGLIHQRARQRNSLLLATAQLGRAMVETLVNPQQSRDSIDVFMAAFPLPLPAISRAISMLPCAVRVGSRLNFWKTKPIFDLRIRVRAESDRR